MVVDTVLEGLSEAMEDMRTEELLAFYFVNLDSEAPAMDEVSPGVRQAMEDFLLTIRQMAPIERLDLVADSNWKVAVENYNDCYHCATAHKSFSKGVVLPDIYTIKPIGKCLNPQAQSSPQQYYEIDYEASPHAAGYRSCYLWPLFTFQIYPGG